MILMMKYRIEKDKRLVHDTLIDQINNIEGNQLNEFTLDPNNIEERNSQMLFDILDNYQSDEDSDYVSTIEKDEMVNDKKTNEKIKITLDKIATETAKLLELENEASINEEKQETTQLLEPENEKLIENKNLW